jgi:hypothetical protein
MQLLVTARKISQQIYTPLRMAAGGGLVFHEHLQNVQKRKR